MPARKVDAEKAQIQHIKDRMSNLLEEVSIPPTVTPIPTPKKVTTTPTTIPTTQPTDNEIADTIAAVRKTVALSVLTDITISIQFLGNDIYIVDKEVRSLPPKELGAFFSQHIHTKLGLGPTQSVIPTPLLREQPCGKQRCSRRIHLNTLGGEIPARGYRAPGPERRCARLRCSNANPSR
jgi:hypothetical protein